MAIDRTSKVAFAELRPRATRMVLADFLRRVLEKLSYQVHTVLTDNGVQFTLQPHQWFPGGHRFARICRAFGGEHRLTTPAHPWTNGQVERRNRTIKEATVQRYHYQTTDELNEHLQAFLLAYNHAKRLKTLRGLTPHEFVCAQWQMNPTFFTQDPTHLTLTLYNPFVDGNGRVHRYLIHHLLARLGFAPPASSFRFRRLSSSTCPRTGRCWSAIPTPCSSSFPGRKQRTTT